VTTPFTVLSVHIGLPPKLCNPNRHTRSWRAKWTHDKAARENAFRCALAALRGRDAPMWKRASLHCVWTFRDARSKTRDDDNMTASIKRYIDGCALAGIVANDNGVRPITHSVTWLSKCPPGAEIGVVLVFTEIPEET
jgi:hypothetical protein